MFTSVEDLLISLKLRALLINEVNGMRDYELVVFLETCYLKQLWLKLWPLYTSLIELSREIGFNDIILERSTLQIVTDIKVNGNN
jgi:hypothetical protein